MRAARGWAAWLAAAALTAGLLAGPAAAAQDEGPAAEAATAELALSRQRAERVAQLDTLSRGHTTPFLASPAPGDPTIVLTPRPAPWTIADVRALFPAALVAGGPSTWLLGQSLFVARGARLQVRGQEVRRLRLLSTPERFVSLSGWRATVELTGSRLHPLTVSSWDPGRGGPDPDPADGRAFVLARGSSMTAMTAGFSHLGFGDGRTSGVAWAGLAAVPGRGIAATPATGAVTSSTFQHNRVGAFSDLAPDMSWTRNQFQANDGHGVDLDGGAGNQVTSNRVERSHVGLYLKRAASGGVVSRNQILASAQFGIYLSEGAFGNQASGNVVKGAFSGIRAKDARRNRIAGNTILEASDSGISLHGDVRGTLVLDNLVSGRGGQEPIERLASPAGLAGVRVEANRTDRWEVARRRLAPADQLRHFLRFHPTALLWLLVLAVPAVALPLRLWHRRRYKTATLGRTDV